LLLSQSEVRNEANADGRHAVHDFKIQPRVGVGIFCAADLTERLTHILFGSRALRELICRGMKNVPLDQIPVSRWCELANTRFRIEDDGAHLVELTLVKVNRSHDPLRGGADCTAAKAENFSLVFRGPGEQLLRQKTYTFEHGQLGRFDLFIVPNGQTSGEFEYEAVFNRLARPA
jgi:hypothetical protein